jgi:hypothetical protein
MIRLVLIALAALLAFAPAAQAECEDVRWEVRWQPDPFGTSGGSLIRVPVCHDGAPAAKPKAKRKKVSRAQLRALRYRPHEAVSERVRQRMIEQLAHGEGAETTRALIASGDLMRQFDESVRAQGWSTRDVADMYAQSYFQLWLAVNDRPRVSTPVVKAVRKELARRLALDPDVGKAGDAAQQETAEWFGSWTVALIGYMNHLRANGDLAGLEAYREHVRERTSAPDLFDVDLTEVRLTRRGIVRR